MHSPLFHLAIQSTKLAVNGNNRSRLALHWALVGTCHFDCAVPFTIDSEAVAGERGICQQRREEQAVLRTHQRTRRQNDTIGCSDIWLQSEELWPLWVRRNRFQHWQARQTVQFCMIGPFKLIVRNSTPSMNNFHRAVNLSLVLKVMNSMMYWPSVAALWNNWEPVFGDDNFLCLAVDLSTQPPVIVNNNINHRRCYFLSSLKLKINVWSWVASYGAAVLRIELFKE